MLKILPNKLPDAYSAQTPICFQPVSDVLDRLFGRYSGQKVFSVSLFAFAMTEGQIEEAFSAASDGSRVIVGREGDPLLVIEGDLPGKNLSGYPALSVSDWYAALDFYRRNVLISFAEKGVLFDAFDGVILCPDASIGSGTRILPGTEIGPGVVIGKNCVIGPRSHLSGCRVGDSVSLRDTRVVDSVIEENVTIGPYCNIRPGSRVCAGCKIGDFVEVKNSVLGEGTHASHLTYIGDSDVGKRVNFGCGVVTANYDGFMKYRTTIGDDAFIGCNTNLVAPVKVGDRAITACGSTITAEVGDDSLGIARARQSNKDGWATRFRAIKSAEKAAKAEKQAEKK